jgi:hypothetical protein
MFLSDRSDMFTSQLAEQEALNGPSLEKATSRYSATLRSSTGSRAKSFQRRTGHCHNRRAEGAGDLRPNCESRRRSRGPRPQDRLRPLGRPDNPAGTRRRCHEMVSCTASRCSSQKCAKRSPVVLKQAALDGHELEGAVRSSPERPVVGSATTSRRPGSSSPAASGSNSRPRRLLVQQDPRSTQHQAGNRPH